MGRNALILVLGFAIITGAMRLSLSSGERRVSQIAYDRFEEYTARNAAHSGVQLALDSIRYDPEWRAGYTDLSLFGADVDVQVYDEISDTTLGKDSLRIAAQGAMGGDSAEVILTVWLKHQEFDTHIVSVLNANSNVKTLGTMVIDGRDHDKDGNLLPNQGTYAVVTTGAYDPEANTTLYGTSAEGLDLGPFHKNDDWTPIVLQNYVWPEGFPQTPEEVLGGEEYGITPDLFKLIAMSGRNGSQYVTDPDDLLFPLRGITYVELESGGTWSANLGDYSEGLIIAHNSDMTAEMSNVNTSLFKGLIIADDMEHLHGDFLGAVFVLRDPLSGNCIGNGNADLLYSKKVIEEVIEDIHLNKVIISVLDYWE